MKTINGKKSEALHWIKIIVIGMLLGLGLQFVQAWTPPPSSPPNGNVSGPITASSIAQTKTGSLTIGDDLLVSDNAVIGTAISVPRICLAGDCRTTWSTASSGTASLAAGDGILLSDSGDETTISTDMGDIAAAIFSGATSHVCNNSEGGTNPLYCDISGTKNMCFITNVYAYDGDNMDGFGCRVTGTPGSADWEIRSYGIDYNQVYCEAKCI